MWRSPSGHWLAVLLYRQVPYQPIQGGLVGVVLLPAGEVADVALVTQLARPRLRTLLHHIVQPDREQDQLLPVALFSERLADLVLDPIAGNGVLGQDQQHLVPEPDRLVDGVEDLGADWHVVGREPAPDALVLEIGMEALRERVVLTRIADEA